jgi:hypothetical protein
VLYQYTELTVVTNTQQVAVVCDIQQNTFPNLQVLLCLWIIKLQCCHFLWGSSVFQKLFSFSWPL